MIEVKRAIGEFDESRSGHDRLSLRVNPPLSTALPTASTHPSLHP
ncbi:hypothetical protein AZ16_2244 [Bordetella bronchiseptica B18-5 (C3)]|nr:hypothetical protein AZ16_2244 [Bordetella bronchiseptica B18-5 (C3)]